MHIFPPGQEGQHRSRPRLLHFVKFSACHSLYRSPWWAVCLQSVPPAAEPTSTSEASTGAEEAASLQETTKLMFSVRSTLSSSCMCFKKCLLAAMMGLMFLSQILQLTSKWFTQPKWFGVKRKRSINPNILLKNTPAAWSTSLFLSVSVSWRKLTLVYFNNDQSHFLTITKQFFYPNFNQRLQIRTYISFAGRPLAVTSMLILHANLNVLLLYKMECKTLEISIWRAFIFAP